MSPSPMTINGNIWQSLRALGLGKRLQASMIANAPNIAFSSLPDRLYCLLPVGYWGNIIR